ncbi:hypothetical protein IE077_000985, partial [Cardiosporidium cionae]
HRLPSLRILRAGNNKIADFSIDLPSLEELLLSHNLLRSFPIFHEFKSLMILDLSYNGITDFWEVVHYLPNIRSLDLSHNRLMIAPSEVMLGFEMLASLSKLRALSLHDNPFCQWFPEYHILIIKIITQIENLNSCPIKKDEKLKAKKFEPFPIEQYDAIFHNRKLQQSDPEAQQFIFTVTPVTKEFSIHYLKELLDC